VPTETVYFLFKYPFHYHFNFNSTQRQRVAIEERRKSVKAQVCADRDSVLFNTIIILIFISISILHSAREKQ